MPLRTNKRLLLAKAESVYATDPIPTGATDAFLVRNMEVQPLEGDLVDRSLIRSFYGASESFLARQRVTISFEIEIAGAGSTVVTLPKYNDLLIACGLNQTIVSGQYAKFTPFSSAQPLSCTLYHYTDGLRVRALGCRGNVRFVFPINEIPYMAFTFIGIPAAMADQANPAATYTYQQTPLLFNNSNTSGFTFFSYSGECAGVEIDLGNELVYRELVGNTKEVLLVNRRTTGTLTIDATTVAQHDYFNDAKSRSTGQLSFLHGTTIGNRCQMICPRTDISTIQQGESDGVATWQIGFNALPSATGNDELEFRTL